jgi:hypothetical protein
MGVNAQMTWVPSTKRWTKNHLGKMYAVSCRQLDCPATKEGSWRAANEWWENKLADLERQAETIKQASIDPTARRVAQYVQSNPMRIVEEAEAGLTAQLVKTLLERLRGRDKSVNVLDALSIAEAMDNVSNAMNRSAVPPGSVATVLGIDGEAELNQRLDRLAVAQEKKANAIDSVGALVKAGPAATKLLILQ